MSARSILGALGVITALAAGVMSAQAMEDSTAQVEATPFDAGIGIGEAVPIIEESTATGDMQTLDALMGEKGVVLAFVRSADWCPFCKAQLIELNKIAEELKAEGYPLVALSYDAADIQAGFIDKQGLTYTMLSDEDSSVIKAFGLLNEEYEPDSRAYGVPHPAIYVIGTDGVVQGKLMEEGYKDRPANEAVLELVNGLAG